MGVEVAGVDLALILHTHRSGKGLAAGGGAGIQNGFPRL